MNFLDFEKPIEELIEQLDKLKETHEKKGIDMSDMISQMEKKIKDEKKVIYNSCFIATNIFFKCSSFIYRKL